MALQFKPRPAMKYLILPGGLLRLFRERSSRSYGWTIHSRNSRKENNICHRFHKATPFNIHAGLRIASRPKDGYLKSDMESIEAFEMENSHGHFYVETLEPSDWRTKYQKCKDANESEISGLLARGGSEYFRKAKLPQNANILGRKLFPSTK